MEKDTKKLAKTDEPDLEDLLDDKKREDAARLGLKVDIGRLDARSTATVQGEAAVAVKRGKAVKAYRRGQYPASGPLREPGDVFVLENEEDFSENWMTHDLEADPVEIAQAVAAVKRDEERKAREEKTAPDLKKREARQSAVKSKLAEQRKAAIPAGTKVPAAKSGSHRDKEAI